MCFNVSLEMPSILRSPVPMWMRSDILRLVILYLHGGVYADVDMEPLRSFEALHGSTRHEVRGSDGRESLKSSSRFSVRCIPCHTTRVSRALRVDRTIRERSASGRMAARFRFSIVRFWSQSR